MTRLSIKANNSSKRVVYNGVDKPDMVCQIHQQTQWHQHIFKLLLLHASKSPTTLAFVRGIWNWTKGLIMNDSLIQVSISVWSWLTQIQSHHFIIKLIYIHHVKIKKGESKMYVTVIHSRATNGCESNISDQMWEKVWSMATWWCCRHLPLDKLTGAFTQIKKTLLTVPN